jgi:phage terminase small subunit
MRQLPPPKDFDGTARALWSTAQRQLRLQGTWERTDLPLLEMYVRNLVAARRDREEADRLRDLESANWGAAAQAAQKAEGAAFALAKVLLLTPEARKKHGVNAPKSTGSELEQLVG